MREGQKFIYRPSGRLCKITNVMVDPFGYNTVTLKGMTTGSEYTLTFEELHERIRMGQLIPIKTETITKWIPRFSFT